MITRIPETELIRTSRRVCALCVAAFALTAATGRAADTTEAFDVGATDFEAYLGFDGIGLDKYQKTISANALLGVGFVEGFSGYLASGAEFNEVFAAGEGWVSFGIFGTPIDTDHFDLDLFLSAEHAPGYAALVPAVEINLDALPDLAGYGLYLRVEEVLAGRDSSVEDDPGTASVDESRERYDFVPATALTIGGYWTLDEIHQVLLEYDMVFHHGKNREPEFIQESTEVGGVALGYNVMVTDAIELISQVSLDVPGEGEDIAFGINVGLIATMPSASP